MPGKVLRYDDFFKDMSKVSDDLKAGLRRSITEEVQITAWGGIFKGNYLLEDEKTWLRGYLLSNGIGLENVSESLMDVVRRGIETMKQSKIGQQVAAKLANVLESGKKFGTYLADALLIAWDKILAFFVKQFEAPKRALYEDLKKTKNHGKNIVANTHEDVLHLKETAAYWLKTFPAKAAAAVKDVFAKEIVGEALSRDAGIIDALISFDPNKLNEGILGGLDKITKSVASIPPFNLLDKVRGISTTGTQTVLKKFSELTKAAGGPGVYEFATLAMISGFFIEYFLEHIATTGVAQVLTSEMILKFIPGANGLIVLVGLVALCVAIIQTVKEIGQAERSLAEPNQ